MRRRGFTMVELCVAAAISMVLLGVLMSVWYLVFSDKRSSNVMGLTTASFARKEGRAALQQLTECLSNGIKVIEPAIGRSDWKLTFGDSANHRVVIKPDDKGVYRSYLDGSLVPEETGTKLELPDGGQISTGTAVEIQKCESLVFTPITPTLVSIKLTIAEAGQQRTLVAAARLGQANALPY